MGKITNEFPNRKLKNPGQTIVGKLAEFVSKPFLVGGASYTSPHFQRHFMS